MGDAWTPPTCPLCGADEPELTADLIVVCGVCGYDGTDVEP